MFDSLVVVSFLSISISIPFHCFCVVCFNHVDNNFFVVLLCRERDIDIQSTTPLDVHRQIHTFNENGYDDDGCGGGLVNVFVLCINHRRKSVSPSLLENRANVGSRGRMAWFEFELDDGSKGDPQGSGEEPPPRLIVSRSDPRLETGEEGAPG